MGNQYKLLGFPRKRQGARLFWLGLLLLAIGLADYFYFSVLGAALSVLWLLAGVAMLLAVLGRLWGGGQTAVLQLEEDRIIIHYGSYKLPIFYENMDIVTGGRIAQHHSLEEFRPRERRAIQPYFNQTQIFIALLKETTELVAAKQRLPRFVFGTTRPGVLLVVAEDWLTVERAIDGARITWLGQVKGSYQEPYRSPTSRVWDEEG